MADETTITAPEAPETPVQETEPKERDWLVEAKKIGWNEEYSGPDKVDAKEYVLRKPLFDQIHSLKKKSRELEAAVRHQRMVQEKLIEQEREKVIADLTKKRMDAIEEGDAKKVVEVEAQIREKEQSLQSPGGGPPPEFLEFVAENEWYDQDEDMRLFADAKGVALYKANPKKPLKELYAEVAAKVREKFPQAFKNPNRTKPSAVEGTTPDPANVKKDLGWDDIPREYRRIAESQWRAGAFVDKKGSPLPRKEAMRLYAEELKRMGEI